MEESPRDPVNEWRGRLHESGERRGRCYGEGQGPANQFQAATGSDEDFAANERLFGLTSAHRNSTGVRGVRLLASSVGLVEVDLKWRLSVLRV